MSDAKIAHIVALPQYIFFIRIATTVISIIVLGLAATTLTEFDGGNSTVNRLSGLDGVAFIVFSCVWTWLVNAYLIVTPLWIPSAYNMWGQLFGDITCTIFWLAGFAATADWASSNADWYQDHPYKKIKSAWGAACGAAGLGAINWVLYCVITVVFIIHLHRHRTDPNNAHLNPLGFAEKGQGHEMGAVPQPQQYAQQQGAPVQYPPVQPTPPPQQWAQSPPPGQYPQ